MPAIHLLRTEMNSSQKLFDSQDVTQSHEASRSYFPCTFSAQQSNKDCRDLETTKEARHRQFYHKYLNKPPLFTPDSTETETENSQLQTWKITQLAELMTKNFEEVLSRTTALDEKLNTDICDIKDNIKCVRIHVEENKKHMENLYKLVESQAQTCLQLTVSNKNLTEAITKMSAQLHNLSECVSNGLQSKRPNVDDNRACQPPQPTKTLVLRKQPNKLLIEPRSSVGQKRKLVDASRYTESRRPAMMFERITSTQRYVMGSPAPQHSVCPEPSSQESSPAFSVHDIFLDDWNSPEAEE